MKPDDYYRELLIDKKAVFDGIERPVTGGGKGPLSKKVRVIDGNAAGILLDSNTVIPVDTSPMVGGGGDSILGENDLWESPRAIKKNSCINPLNCRPGEHWLNVGWDLGFTELVELNMTSLVGKFSYAMPRRDIVKWVTRSWAPILDYTPWISILAKGWFGFKFREEAHALLILEKLWLKGSGSLMLQRWYTDFDPRHARIEIRHLWVLLPDFPLALWNREAFELVGNRLGCFLHLGVDMQKRVEKRIGRILVEVDVSLGLIDELHIEWQGRQFTHIIDYWGVPFRCSNYKEVGNLWRDCAGSSTGRDSSHSIEVEAYWSSDACSDKDLDAVGPLDGFSNRVLPPLSILTDYLGF